MVGNSSIAVQLTLQASTSAPEATLTDANSGGSNGVAGGGTAPRRIHGQLLQSERQATDTMTGSIVLKNANARTGDAYTFAMGPNQFGHSTTVNLLQRQLAATRTHRLAAAITSSIATSTSRRCQRHRRTLT